MNVLIACEESQTVCKAFRERGHNAFSCDIIEPSGGHPEWHILGDVIPIIEGGASSHDGWSCARYRPVGFDDSTSALHVYDQRRSGEDASQRADRAGAIRKGDGGKSVLYAVL